jgi:hypothetical protein
MKFSIRLICIASATLLFFSCASFNQNISIAPVETQFPVSASRTIYDGGKIIAEDQMKERTPFSVTQEFKVPMGADTGKIDLTPLLNAQIAGTQFNGVTQLNVDIAKIDNSVATYVMLERYSSIVLLACGAALAGIESINGDKADYSSSIGVIGVSAALFGGSFVHNHFGSIKYTVNMNGVGVRY